MAIHWIYARVTHAERRTLSRSGNRRFTVTIDQEPYVINTATDSAVNYDIENAVSEGRRVALGVERGVISYIQETDGSAFREKLGAE